MKENNLKIFLVLFLGLLAIALIVFMILLLHNDNKTFTFFGKKKESKLILEKSYHTDEFEKIIVNSPVSDIKILASENEEVKVMIYGSEKDNVSSILENNQLSISHEKKSRICIGFCIFNKEEVLVYLPENKIKALDLKSVSGDIFVTNTFDTNLDIKTTSGDIEATSGKEVKVETTSGDIKIESLNDGLLKTVSGDIYLENANNQLEIGTTSGDIKIKNFNCQANSNIKSVSGDVSISHLQGAYVEAKSTSGDIKTDGSDRYSLNTLVIKTTSGDINIK